MGINCNSLINTNQGLLFISLLTTDSIIEFCYPHTSINVNIDIESFQNRGNIIKIFNLGEQQVIKINVENNYYIIGTLNQEILTELNEWKQLKDLNINDKCIIKKHYNVFSKQNLINKKEISTLVSIDRIVESSITTQLTYLQKIFDKYANVKNDIIILDLTNFNSEQQDQIHILLLQYGIISLLHNNQLIINKDYIQIFKNIINFSNKKQELLNMELPDIDNNEYINLPITNIQYINSEEVYQLIVNSQNNSYVANGFIIRSMQEDYIN